MGWKQINNLFSREGQKGHGTKAYVHGGRPQHQQQQEEEKQEERQGQEMSQVSVPALKDFSVLILIDA